MPINPSNEYFLGIDGGGTKTEVVISDSSGFVLGRGISSGSNFHNLTFDLIYRNIQDAVKQANHSVNVNLLNFSSVCLGIAGIDTPSERQKFADSLKKIPPDSRIFWSQKFCLCQDGLIGLMSGTSQKYGVCLIASTGANCFGVNSLGKSATAGDWGYLLGDQGSGFAIGLKIIKTVIKEFDGRRPVSPMTDLVLSSLKLSEVRDLIAWAYDGPVRVKEIASLSRLLDAPEFIGTIDHFEIIKDTVQELMEAYLSVICRLDLKNQHYPLVMVGGLFKSAHIKTQLVSKISEKTPMAVILSPDRTPAEGAIRVAINCRDYQKLLI